MKHLLFTIILLSACLGARAQAIFSNDFKTFNTGQAFSCIVVDTANNVWAGTNKQGLYLLDQKHNASATQFTNAVSGAPLGGYIIQGLAADRSGNLWVAHTGTNATTGSAGGIERLNINDPSSIQHFSADRNAKGFTFLARDGIATLNVKAITVDINNTIWSAHKNHSLTSGSDFILTPGSISFKTNNETKFTSKATWNGFQNGEVAPELPYPAYTYNPTPTQTPYSRTFSSIACDANEVWASHLAYLANDEVTSIPARVLRYDLTGNYLGQITFATVGVPAGGIFNGIYLSPTNQKWLTLSAGKGFAVLDSGSWKYINTTVLPPCILPEGTAVNENAIWGNRYGNVFIGTNKGLIVYNGRGSVTDPASYARYSMAVHPFPSDNILGGYTERDSIQWIATDNGIARAIIGRYPTLVCTCEPNGRSAGARIQTDNLFKECSSPHPDMLAVEERLKAPGAKQDKSYHVYRVETEICKQDDPNTGRLCTVENIYKMMKEDITLTAVIPYDFPLDDLTKPFLDMVTQQDLVQIVNKINTWQMDPVITPNSQMGDVKYIKDLVTRPELKEALESNGFLFPIGKFFSESYTALSKKELYDKQLRENLRQAVSCTASYRLYNSPNFIASRNVFRSGLHGIGITRSISGCSDYTDKNFESIEYDPIYTYTSDNDYTITNYTALGHFLYPGKITRHVIQECGAIKIVTNGEGLQFCGNNSAGKRNAVGNTVAGAFLFKNVDFRLKRAFQKSAGN